MRIALIACAVLQRELSYEIVQSNNIVRGFWLNQGLHDTPDLLRTQLQTEIDRIETMQLTASADKKWDAICLGYGLCSNGIIGLRSANIPLVIPRCDDCMSLFLGSAERYLQLFHQHSGIYWYSPGWIEHAFTPSVSSYEVRFQTYVEQYGEDNAAYLMEAEKEWIQNYQNCIYIHSPVYDNPAYERYAAQAAADFSWQLHHEAGNQHLFHHLLNGPWNEQEFLVVPPNSAVEAEFSGKKIQAVCQTPT